VNGSRKEASTPIDKRKAKPRTCKQNSTRVDAYLTALLAGHGYSEACEEAGISRSLGLVLRKDPAFQARFAEERKAMFSRMVSKLHADSFDFANVLHTIAQDEKARGSDRVLAGRHGLDILLRAVESVDFSERLTAVEQQIEEAKK